MKITTMNRQKLMTSALSYQETKQILNIKKIHKVTTACLHAFLVTSWIHNNHSQQVYCMVSRSIGSTSTLSCRIYIINVSKYGHRYPNVAPNLFQHSVHRANKKKHEALKPKTKKPQNIPKYLLDWLWWKVNKWHHTCSRL